MDMTTVTNKMFVLFLQMLLGVVAGKARLIDDAMSKKLTGLLLNICTPCMILNAVINNNVDLALADIFRLLGFSCCFYLLLIALALIVPWLMRCPPNTRGVYSFMTIFGNAVTLGYPVISAIFGPNAVFYAAVMGIPHNILAYSIGPMLLTSGQQKGKLNIKQLINPALIATLTAIVLFVLHVRLPAPINDTIATMGGAVSPMGMIIIGASVGKMKLKDTLADWRMYVFIVYRLLLGPIIVWAVMHRLVSDTTVLGIMVIDAGMPVGTLSTMLTIQYGGDATLSSKVIVFTTALTVVTVPAVLSILPF